MTVTLTTTRTLHLVDIENLVGDPFATKTRCARRARPLPRARRLPRRRPDRRRGEPGPDPRDRLRPPRAVQRARGTRRGRRRPDPARAGRARLGRRRGSTGWSSAAATPRSSRPRSRSATSAPRSSSCPARSSLSRRLQGEGLGVRILTEPRRGARRLTRAHQIEGLRRRGQGAAGALRTTVTVRPCPHTRTADTNPGAGTMIVDLPLEQPRLMDDVSSPDGTGFAEWATGLANVIAARATTAYLVGRGLAAEVDDVRAGEDGVARSPRSGGDSLLTAGAPGSSAGRWSSASRGSRSRSFRRRTFSSWVLAE